MFMSLTRSVSPQAKDAFLIPRASTTKTKSKHGVKKEKASAVIGRYRYSYCILG